MRVSCQTMALRIGRPVRRSQSDGGLALVRDPDGGQVARLGCPAFARRLARSRRRRAPDLVGVVLDPARPGVDLAVLALGDRDDRRPRGRTRRSGVLVVPWSRAPTNLVIWLGSSRSDRPSAGASSNAAADRGPGSVRRAGPGLLAAILTGRAEARGVTARRPRLPWRPGPRPQPSWRAMTFAAASTDSIGEVRVQAQHRPPHDHVRQRARSLRPDRVDDFRGQRAAALVEDRAQLPVAADRARRPRARGRRRSTGGAWPRGRRSRCWPGTTPRTRRSLEVRPPGSASRRVGDRRLRTPSFWTTTLSTASWPRLRNVVSLPPTIVTSPSTSGAWSLTTWWRVILAGLSFGS